MDFFHCLPLFLLWLLAECCFGARMRAEWPRIGTILALRRNECLTDWIVLQSNGSTINYIKLPSMINQNSSRLLVAYLQFGADFHACSLLVNTDSTKNTRHGMRPGGLTMERQHFTSLASLIGGTKMCKAVRYFA